MNVKTFRYSLAATLLAAGFLSQSLAQPTVAPAETASRTNSAIVPAQRSDERGRTRSEEVLKRAKENQGPLDIAFIGDSITQGWERAGNDAWQKYYGSRNCLNFGVGGDRTQHVLWRFEQGQLDGLKPKVAVVMIGTNNSNREDHTEAEILEGITEIVNQIRARLPETRILLVSIFPRGQTFSAQRGKILQVNQALSKLHAQDNTYYVDFGGRLIEKDGSISKEIMPDYLHLSERGYEIWAESIEPMLKRLLN
jgi:lysophospholipase L1-like esterase